MRIEGRGSALVGATVFLFEALSEPAARAQTTKPTSEAASPPDKVERTHKVTEEVTLGALGETKGSPKTPYFSNRLGGELDVSSVTSLRLDTVLTHYAPESRISATNVFQLLLGTTWEPSDHWSFDGDLALSPKSSTVTTTPRTATSPQERSAARTSSVGAVFTGEYDTATDGDLDTVLDLTLGATRYSTTQATRVGRGVLAAPGNSEKEALVQARVALGVTETILTNTDVEVVGTYYLYNRDPTGSGYYGENVFGRGAVSDGFPLEPMRYSVRPTLVERFGDLRILASFQYAGDVDSSGHSILFGGKLQYRFSDAVKAWLAAYHQAEKLPTSETEMINFGSVGASFYF